MEEYDVVVVGSGSGLDVANAAIGKDLDVAVIEKGPLGGTCLNRGCIPSKMLIHRADLAESIENSEKFGIDSTINQVNFGEMVREVNQHVRKDAESIERGLRNSEDHKLYKEEAEFIGERTLKVGDEKIRGEKVILAAGARPVIPPVEGIEGVNYLTSKEALELEEQPEKLLILGGGYIAAELAHFYGSLGTDISIIEMKKTLVNNEDTEIREKFTELFERKYDVNLGYKATRVFEREGVVTVEAENEEGDVIQESGDAFLVAAGRRPNTDTLKVENAGIDTDEKGFVETNEFLEASADNVWALGDIAGNYMFKHSANHEAQYVFWNAFTDHRHEVDYTAMPHAIFSSPQIAGVGKTEQQLEEEGAEFIKSTYPYERTAMGSALKEKEGFVKILVDPNSREILGCHIIGPQASVLIHEVIVSMKSGSGKIDDILNSVHIHPALSEVVQRAFASL